MPLITAAVIAYVAGLLTGFGSPAAWSVIVVALAAWHVARSARDVIALGCIAVAGYAAATVSLRVAASCGARIAESREWTVVVEADAYPGAFVPARTACGAVMHLSV